MRKLQSMANPGPRSPQLIPSNNSSPSVSHRQSFADNLRGMPASPRASRQPSLSQQALQDLLNNPPVAKTPQNAAFQGRDWRSVKVGEVIDPGLVRFVEIDTSVEEATNVSVSCGAPRFSCAFTSLSFHMNVHVLTGDLGSDLLGLSQCRPSPREQGISRCYRHLRLQRPECLPPSCGWSCAPRGLRDTIFQ